MAEKKATVSAAIKKGADLEGANLDFSSYHRKGVRTITRR
jgi:hypothetical protein